MLIQRVIYLLMVTEASAADGSGEWDDHEEKKKEDEEGSAYIIIIAVVVIQIRPLLNCTGMDRIITIYKIARVQLKEFSKGLIII